MNAVISRFVVLPIVAIAIGCEAMPEEFFFVNDTDARVEVIFYDPPQGPFDHGFAAPGDTFRYARRPAALHGEKWFAKVDDEEQFLDMMIDGVTFADDQGHRVFMDAKTLRVQMAYKSPRQFTMHIKPGFFAPRR